ncbi:unnamed protein product [Gordionus sp. m RMFG-2023]
MSLGLGYTSSLAAVLGNLQDITSRITENTSPKIKETRKKLLELTNEWRNNIAEHSITSSKYTHLLKPKKKWELFLISAVICGIELAYSAETAFVTPILLKIGIPTSYMSLIWCLSPILGLILVPIMGSMSDNCRSRFGRRRPFIFFLSLGIILGLILVPNGKYLGAMLGGGRYVKDSETPLEIAHNHGNSNIISNKNKFFIANGSDYYYDYYYYDDNITTENKSENVFKNIIETSTSSYQISRQVRITNIVDKGEFESIQTKERVVTKDKLYSSKRSKVLSILVTCLGVIILDFCSDASQSPSRAYMLDVCLPEQHTMGLSAFTIFAGAGGSFGYMLGAIDWEHSDFLKNKSGKMFMDHYRIVFGIILVLFIVCLIVTLNSFKELPLDGLIYDTPPKNKFSLAAIKRYILGTNVYSTLDNNIEKSFVSMSPVLATPPKVSTTIDNFNEFHKTNNFSLYNKTLSEDANWEEMSDTSNSNNLYEDNLQAKVKKVKSPVSLKSYLKSIIRMPRFLKILCLTNLFSWMSLVCYSLYFTDYVGQHIFRGDPKFPENSLIHKTYEKGVRFGCWGMASYSMTCAVYSYYIERLVKKFG